MSARVHWKDHAGALCGFGWRLPNGPKYAEAPALITCKSCAKKLRSMLGIAGEFFVLVREAMREEDEAADKLPEPPPEEKKP